MSTSKIQPGQTFTFEGKEFKCIQFLDYPQYYKPTYVCINSEGYECHFSLEDEDGMIAVE